MSPTGNSFWYEAGSDILKSALYQTASELGMIGVADGNGRFSLLAIEGSYSVPVLNNELYRETVHHLRTIGCLELPSLDNLIGRCITHGEAVIANRGDKDRRAANRFPEGLPSLSCFLGLPISHEHEIIGMIGVANRPGGYSWRERSQLDHLTEAVKALLRCYRQRQHERQLEDQLRQAQKMEALGKLVGGVAHDFNNVLTVIMGHCDLASASDSEMSRAKSLVEVKKASTRAQSLIQQLMAFTRRQVIQRQAIDVGTLLRETGAMLHRTIGERIGLAVSTAPDTCRILADKGQLERVIVNIVINARDAMPAGGQIIISARNCHWPPGHSRDGVSFSGRFVEIAISDTGSGMDEQTRRRIFEPFFTTKPVGKGTGLGLSTAYGIVKQNDGYIFVDSIPDQGSTFLVYLPVTDIPIGPTEVIPSPSEVQQGGKTILLLDDEEPVRTVIRRVLEDARYTVLEAGNGREAMDLASRHGKRLDLVIADVMLSGETGCEVVSRLRGTQADIQVLYISGYTEDSFGQSKLLETARPLLRKPFQPETLAKAVQAIVAHGRKPTA